MTSTQSKQACQHCGSLCFPGNGHAKIRTPIEEQNAWSALSDLLLLLDRSKLRPDTQEAYDVAQRLLANEVPQRRDI